MTVGNCGVSLRARLTIAAVSIGAVAIAAFMVLRFGSRTGPALTASEAGQNPDRFARMR